MGGFRSGARHIKAMSMHTTHSHEALAGYFQSERELIGYVDPDTGLIATRTTWDINTRMATIYWEAPAVASYTNGYYGGGGGGSIKWDSNYANYTNVVSTNATYEYNLKAQAPRALSPMEWLNAEVETTCKKGRLK